MVTDKSEEEQVEALKKWWDENGTQLLIGIVVVLGGVFGFRTWEANQTETAETASKLYEDLTQVVNLGPFDRMTDEDRKTADFIIEQLTTDYAGSTYAHFASLHAAKIKVEADDLDGAEAALRWSLENGVEESFGLLVNERLARVLFAKEDYEAALKVLDSKDPNAYKHSYEELRGDIYVAMDNLEEARAAYERALASVDDPEQYPFLRMKSQDISAPAKAIAAEAEDTTENEGDTVEG